MEQMLKKTMMKLSTDEYNECLLKNKFVKIRGNTNTYIILNISKDNLGDYYKLINFTNLKGILVFFTFHHIHSIFDYSNNDIKPLFI